MQAELYLLAGDVDLKMCVDFALEEDGEEDTCPLAEGSTAEIVGESGTWRAFQQQPSFSAECWFLLVLSAHRRLPSGLTTLCNSDLSHHIAHIFSE